MTDEQRPLAVIGPHDFDCQSRALPGGECTCSRTGRSINPHHPAGAKLTEPTLLGSMTFHAAHGGISYELYAHSMASPLFKGWAINPAALEEQLCQAVDGLGEFYEELES